MNQKIEKTDQENRAITISIKRSLLTKHAAIKTQDRFSEPLLEFFSFVFAIVLFFLWFVHFWSSRYFRFFVRYFGNDLYFFVSC